MEGWGEFMRGRKKKKLSAKMFTAITAPLLAGSPFGIFGFAVSYYNRQV